MSKTLVSLEVRGPHAVITFASEEAVNILTHDVIHSFGAVVAQIRKDSSVRTTSIHAEGKVFLAGADIRSMTDFTPDQAREYAELGQGVLNDLEALPCVTVAAINGAAMGGGLEFALACDFRIAVKHARLGQPEVTLGLIPGWGGIQRMAKLVGPARAKRFFLSGHPVSAEEAHHFGLVDETVNSAEDLVHRVNVFCKSFGKSSPTAVALAKRAFRDHDDLQAFSECFQTRDSREGMRAFLEKRPTSWSEAG